MSRFVRPETDTLKISQGDTLVVKKRLNAGERREMFAGMYRETVAGGMALNPVKTGIATILAYLVDWSLKDDDDKLVNIRGLSVDGLQSSVDALDPDSYTEILRAIETHAEVMTVDREKEKNGQGTEIPSSAISPSPSDSAGATSG